MQSLKHKNKTESLQVPRDYIVSPIFASTKQKAGRIVELKKYDRTYEIGGFDPMPVAGNEKPCPALDIRHGRAIFTILTFYQDLYGSFEDSSNERFRIRFSLNQFIKRYSNSNGGRYSGDIKLILKDLLSCWFRVTYANGDKKTYRILKDICIHSKVKRRKNINLPVFSQDELWLDEVELHPEFYNLLSNYAELGKINLKVLTAIRSNLAQSIYTYIPSRILYRTEENAFSVNLTTILQELGHKVPVKKSLRKQLFTQNESSVLSQLDGLPFSQGILKVKLVETENHHDYKLLFWNGCVSNSKRHKINSQFPKLRAYWLKSGRTDREFNLKLSKLCDSIEGYQEEVIKRAKIRLEGNEMFMRCALTLLGREKFDELASEVKALTIEPNSSIKDPTKVFIHFVCKAISKYVK